MSSHRSLAFAVLLGLSTAAPCAAQTPFAAQPLVHARNGAVHGCGVRLTGGNPAARASSWFDVSFNVFRRGVALAHSVAYEIRSSGIEGDAKPARTPVQSTWMKGPKGSARLGENSERRETLVYTLALDEALTLFQAVAAGEPVTVGIKRWDEPAATVYAGKPSLSSEARRELGACLDRLVD